jgi:hypothetical protein
MGAAVRQTSFVAPLVELVAETLLTERLAEFAYKENEMPRFRGKNRLCERRQHWQ